MITCVIFMCNIQDLLNHTFFYFFYLENTKSFNTHTHKGREKKVLKKLTVIYIQKGLTLRYTTQWLYTITLSESWIKIIEIEVED